MARIVRVGGVLLCMLAIGVLVRSPFVWRSWLVNRGMRAYIWAEVGGAEQDNYVLAESMLRQASGEQGDNFRLCWALGRVYLAQGRADRAAEWLRAAADLAPENPMVNLALGNTYDQAGQRDLAVSAWRAAGAAPTFSLLGDLSWQQRDGNTAEEQYWKAVQTDPSYVEPLYRLQDVYWSRGDKQKVEDVLVMTLKADTSSSARRFVAQGLLHQIRGQPDLAIENYEQALDMDPLWTRPYSRLAEIWWGSKGDGDRAAFYYQQLIEIAPDRWGVFVALGDIYRAQGRQADAREMYLCALALDGLDAGARENLQERLESLED